MVKQNRGVNIAGLFRLLTILAFLSGVAIVALSVFGVHNLYSQHVISMAEKESTLISRLLIDQHSDILFLSNETEDLHLHIEPSYEAWLDLRLRRFLQPFDIIKIKIFSPDTTVIYSTDSSIIGETNPQNTRLLRALMGEVDSHLENKDSFRDLANETVLDVDVVETYTPIIVDGQILGVFELYRDVTQFREDILAGTLKTLVFLSAIMLIVHIIAFSVARIGMKQVATAEEKLRKQAMTDALTGIFNRGELMTRAEEEAARFSRHRPDGDNRKLSFIMLDIDHFKRVNDVYGHLAGDAVLRQLPDRIKQGLRLYDILGRYGGEEFLLLLPKADLPDAVTIAERIRCAIADEPFQFNDFSIDTTVSLGVSTLTKETSLTEAIELADQALYRAKQNGRNRVEFHKINCPAIPQIAVDKPSGKLQPPA